MGEETKGIDFSTNIGFGASIKFWLALLVVQIIVMVMHVGIAIDRSLY